MSAVVNELTRLNPFGNSRIDEDDSEDAGEKMEAGSVAGGGRGAYRSAMARAQLRVSHALRSFLAHHGALPQADVESDDPSPALAALLEKPLVAVPAELTDRSHPLPEYFISSSHNTYLMGQQLIGKSSARAYEMALNTGARCVEIDAWDNEADRAEPKVTHGYTLVSHIPFRAVCETIRDVVDAEAAQADQDAEDGNRKTYRPAPIFLSLENHCGADGQQRLVDIMREVWAERLLSEAVRQKGHDHQAGGAPVTLAELGSKICLIVEHRLGAGSGERERGVNEGGDDDDDDGEQQPKDDEAEEEKKVEERSLTTETEEMKLTREARAEYEALKKQTAKNAIIPSLAALGVYAQSVKPVDNSWFDDPPLKNGPHDHLINVSEVQLAKHLPKAAAPISVHNAQHLMRVFPRGTRVSSQNMKPAPFWGVGAQICALNWQSFGASMQLNEALFAGTDGYVLKPAALRAGGDGEVTTWTRTRLRLHVAGATDVPLPAGRDNPGDIKPYLTCTLVHPSNLGDDQGKRRTKSYRQHKLGFLHRGENPPATEPVWDEELMWEFGGNELVFLRLLLKSDDAFARNPVLAAAAVRLSYTEAARGEWRFVRMLDLRGRETACSLLCKFEVEEMGGEEEREKAKIEKEKEDEEERGRAPEDEAEGSAEE